MDLFLNAIISIVYLSYRLGKEDGRWGCFTSIVVFVVIAYIVSLRG